MFSVIALAVMPEAATFFLDYNKSGIPNSISINAVLYPVTYNPIQKSLQHQESCLFFAYSFESIISRLKRSFNFLFFFSDDWYLLLLA